MEVIFHAFGSISEGTTEGKLMEIAAFIIDPMLDALKNGPSNYTKVIAAWALARLFRSVPCTRLEIPQIIKERCRTIIFHLTSSMNDVLEVAENACAALYYFLEIFERAPKQVVPYVLYFLPALCSLTHRADCSEYLRTVAYESINRAMAWEFVEKKQAELVLQSHGTTSDGDVHTALQLAVNARAEHSSSPLTPVCENMLQAFCDGFYIKRLKPPSGFPPSACQ